MMSKNIIPFEFHILMGLPGSGKTYWAEHNYPTSNFCNHNGRMIVKLDDYKDEKNCVRMALNEEFKTYMECCHVKKVDVCVDGPLTTYNHLEKVIDEILSYIKNNCQWEQNGFGDYELSFIIHQWDENREYCLYNDYCRNREIKATNSIKNFEYTIITDNHLKELKKHIEDLRVNVKTIKKVEHMVKKTTTYEQMFEPACDNYHGHGNDPSGIYMYSEEWSLGGEWGNCWGDHGNIGGEQPKEFIELDDFLEKVAPNITFLQYKKIKHHCVEIIDWHIPDYYSSGTDEACWRCDMKKLYEMLKEMNYIED